MLEELERTELLKQLRHKYYQLFSSPLGAEILEDLRRRFYYRSSYAQGDPQHTVFREGQRDTVLFILNMIRGGKDA